MVAPRPQDRIAILGGGIAGLAIANLCARLNPRASITLFERNSWLGGKLRRYSHAGQMWDVGPSIFTIPHIWQQFNALAKQLDAQHPLSDLDFVRLDGLGQFLCERYDFSLPPSSSDHEFEGWQRYVKRHAPMESLITQLMLTPPRSGRAAALALRLLAAYKGRLNVASVLEHDSYLSAELREVIKIHSLNAGLSPAHAFNLYASVPALLAQSGVFIPAGGMYELVQHLIAGLKPFAARVRLCTNTDVSFIDLAKRTIKVDVAVEAQPFDIIVNALDHDRFVTLTTGERPSPTKTRFSCSAAGFYMILKPGTKINLKHPHTVLMPRDFNQFTEQLDREQQLDSTMSFLNYYAAGSQIYPGNTRDILAFLLTVPADGARYSAEHPLVRKEFARAAILLGWENAITTMVDHIEVVDPQYFGSFGAAGGSIYGRAVPWQQQGPMQQVQHQDRVYKNLFHVGASVYPGGGVPAILAGVQLTAERILKFKG